MVHRSSWFSACLLANGRVDAVLTAPPVRVASARRSEAARLLLRIVALHFAPQKDQR
jgi:hypothetical protein